MLQTNHTRQALVHRSICFLVNSSLLSATVVSGIFSQHLSNLKMENRHITLMCLGLSDSPTCTPCIPLFYVHRRQTWLKMLSPLHAYYGSRWVLLWLKMSLLQVHIRQVKYRYKHISVIQIHIIHTNQLSALHTYYGSRCVQYRYTPHKCTTDTHHTSVLQIHTTQVYYRYTPYKCTTDTHHASVLQIHTT